MKYVAAYLLAQLGGNDAPSAVDIKKILSSVGIDSDSSRVEALLAEVSGKSVDEMIKAGSSKLASMPAGGAAAPAASAGAAASESKAAPAAAAAAPAKEESEEEEMGFGLFD